MLYDVLRVLRVHSEILGSPVSSFLRLSGPDIVLLLPKCWTSEIAILDFVLDLCLFCFIFPLKVFHYLEGKKLKGKKKNWLNITSTQYVQNR